MLAETQKKFSLIRAAPSTLGRSSTHCLSTTLRKRRSPAKAARARNPRALDAEIFDALVLGENEDELMRRLGYPGQSPKRPLPDLIKRALRDGRKHLAPKGAYALYAVEELTPKRLSLGGVAIAGRVGKFFTGAERIAVFVATAGASITAEARDAAQRGDTVTGFALDALGSYAAEAAADALMAKIQKHLGPGEGLSLRHSPGYCSMRLAEQRSIFALVEAGAIGISLLPSMMMSPLKSVSGLVALGPANCWSKQTSPCATCGDQGCPARR